MLYHERERKNKKHAEFRSYCISVGQVMHNEAFFIDVSILNSADRQYSCGFSTFSTVLYFVRNVIVQISCEQNGFISFCTACYS